MDNMEEKMLRDYSDISDSIADELKEGGATIKPYEVDCLPNDYNVSTLLSFIDRGYLKIPSFQRNYIWKKEMASKFIESIILGLPIPQIFLFEEARNNFLVIDGQQRLVTLYLFKNQRFPKNNEGREAIRKYLSEGKTIPKSELGSDNFEDFTLKLPESTPGEKNLLDKKKYDTLPSTHHYDFKGDFDFNRTTRTMTIRQVSPANDYSSMLEIFSRLNSGGVTLKPQEIRMSMFRSNFNEKVVDTFNKDIRWRKFLGKDKPDLHMVDVEILVRAFAMLELGHTYQAPMGKFLDRFSKDAKEFDESRINELHLIFDDFLNSCELLSNNAFKNEAKKFVIALFDSVFTAVCKKIRAEGLNGRKIQPKSIELLIDDLEFSKALQGNTASVVNVNTRITAASRSVILE
jgi:uncharacterized protein with ParB-like and HNH nuclease domain